METTQEEQTELKDQFTIKFDGEKNQIDANTFVNYLIHLNTIIQEINHEIQPERKIKVKINALSEGSFLVEIELQSIIAQIRQLFTKDNVEYLAALFGVYQGIILLKEKLVGQKPKEVSTQGNTIIIVLPDGKILEVSREVYGLYRNNTTLNQALNKQFETLEQDPEISSVKVLDKENRPVVDVRRDQFSVLASPNESVEAGLTQEIRGNAILSIIKLSFDSKLKSDFYYHGIKITALIKDKVFYDSVDMGEQFAKGDALEVRLQVNKVYDQSVNTDVIRGYEILEVIKHHPRSDKSQLVIDIS